MLEKKKQDKYAWKILVLALVIGLVAGLLGTVLAAQIFIKPGPQGEQGPTGPQGPTGETGTQGPEGPQGIAGVNGTDSILQILQNRNETQVDISNATKMQWYNLSDFDSSMRITINIQQNSKIFAQFSSTHQLEATASISARIVVDNNYNSSTYKCSIGPPAAPRVLIPGHVEFLTDSLNAGSHTINVQFLVENGSPVMLDRTLTVMEITSQ